MTAELGACESSPVIVIHLGLPMIAIRQLQHRWLAAPAIVGRRNYNMRRQDSGVSRCIHGHDGW